MCNLHIYNSVYFWYNKDRVDLWNAFRLNTDTQMEDNDMRQMPNKMEMIVPLNIKRVDLCNLIIATGVLGERDNRMRLILLHDKLIEILKDFDRKNNI